MRQLVLLASLLIAPVAQAQQGKCPDASGIARTECLERNLKSARAELQRLYPKAIASIHSKDNSHIPKPELDKWKAEAEASQRAWQTYRDIECDKVVLYRWWGGSGAGGASIACSLQKTIARISELKTTYGIK